ncbi:hypothetical protein LEP1GSC018_1992 [Leptospira kirschneri str. 2008720114]|nr:hypothetical protein LEP1GSC018_1992 [Leptospira kirschneri str. 2008720114]
MKIELKINGRFCKDSEVFKTTSNLKLSAFLKKIPHSNF